MLRALEPLGKKRCRGKALAPHRYDRNYAPKFLYKRISVAVQSYHRRSAGEPRVNDQIGIGTVVPESTAAIGAEIRALQTGARHDAQRSCRGERRLRQPCQRNRAGRGEPFAGQDRKTRRRARRASPRGSSPTRRRVTGHWNANMSSAPKTAATSTWSTANRRGFGLCRLAPVQLHRRRFLHGPVRFPSAERQTRAAHDVLFTRAKAKQHVVVIDGELILRLQDEEITLRAGRQLLDPRRRCRTMSSTAATRVTRAIWVNAPVILPAQWHRRKPASNVTRVKARGARHMTARAGPANRQRAHRPSCEQERRDRPSTNPTGSK
jgi:hypothetical protein